MALSLSFGIVSTRCASWAHYQKSSKYCSDRAICTIKRREL